ncbi:MAG TPA: thrombospondin type 3 repeat-containing protein [Polyangiaceae bacterium LLY-WYZ-14_1]|nr:thrombospondin type 3 repeat-containing protein [Polyangiaceae bacterium LLY-WYZ-14_1]
MARGRRDRRASLQEGSVRDRWRPGPGAPAIDAGAWAALLTVLLVVLLGWPEAARAQGGAPPLDEFSTVTFKPAPGPGNGLATDGATVRGHLAPSAGLIFDYAHEPFVLFTAECDANGDNCEVTGVESRLVRYTALAHLTASLSLFDRVQLGLVLPVGFTSGEQFNVTLPGGDPVAFPGESTFALADPRFHVKANLFGGDGDLFRLAVAGWVDAPLGQIVAEDRFVGDPTVSAGGHLIAEIDTETVRAAVNLGGLWREEGTLFSTSVGPQLTWAGMVGLRLTPLFGLLVEGQGGTSFSSIVDENPVEARLGLTFQIGDVELLTAGGAGLSSGVGVPVFRVLAGLRWSPLARDSDGDGIDDEADACPTEVEDADGFRDEDGCPELDNDEDGLPDLDDPCPDLPEDQDGVEDGDGCPDLDNDGDGIQDGYDSCPGEPEDVDGDRDEDGCPDQDEDQDGIVDEEDQCPNEPEDTDGYGDFDGCPEDDFDGDGFLDSEGDFCPDQPETLNGIEDDDGCPEDDTDDDGIVDVVDRCPDEAETYNNRADQDGCPDGRATAALIDGRVEFARPLRFARRGGRLRGRSRGDLTAAARILRNHPELGVISIRVRADDRDAAEARAAYIQAYLVRRAGIPERRTRLDIGAGPEEVVFIGTGTVED